MRYYKQEIIFNDTTQYKKYLKPRGLKYINHYETPKFDYPSAGEIRNFKTEQHVWSTGDRFFKLAHQYYDDSTKWWVIAFFNQKPTEFHVKLGQTIFIPYPLEAVLFHMGY
jgi:nucleoid-associated protein YgaU